MNINIKLGTSIFELLEDSKMSIQEFADSLGISERESQKIIEGKVVLSPRDIERIAKVFSISKFELIERENSNLVPHLEYRKTFSDEKNLEKVIRLMDEYVELVEMIS